jgi:hypothetical protein
MWTDERLVSGSRQNRFLIARRGIFGPWILSTIPDIFELIEMTRNMSVVLYVVLLIAVVVSVDFLFFKNRFWERLMANIGIVLVFAAFYLRFLKKS